MFQTQRGWRRYAGARGLASSLQGAAASSGSRSGTASDAEDGHTDHLAAHPLRHAWRDLKPWRKAIAGAAIAVLFATLVRLSVPQFVNIGIDKGVARGSEGAGILLAATLGGVAALGVSYFLQRLQILLVARVGERFLFELRKKVFSHIQSLHIDFFDKELVGRLVARMTSDVEALNAFLSQGLVILVSSTLSFFIAMSILFTMSWKLTLATMTVVPFLILATVLFRQQASKAYLKVRERVSQVMARLQENLSGVRVVQAFGKEQEDASTFRGLNEAQFEAQLHTARLQSFYFPTVEFLGMAAVAIVLGYGSYLAANGQIGFGVVAAFLLYLSNVFEPIQQVSQLYNEVQAASAALAKLYGIVEITPRVKDAIDARELVVEKGEIELRNISFSYDGVKKALDGVDLELPGGSRVAVVGKTGAGKSTLAKLIARFYDPDEGVVMIDGQDLSEATLESVRRHVVFVPQEGFIFSGTVWQNIAMGWDESLREDAIDACKALGIYETLASLPQGLDTPITGQGQMLSGGQRQLIGLARAFVCNPSVLVLDEAVSAVDPATAAAIERALANLLPGRTSITIAHRMTTAVSADLIVVMAAGRVVECGRHEDLLRREGYYASLWSSWMRGSAFEGQV
jgi:ATP-binding cassette, subfamily B, bacterial